MSEFEPIIICYACEYCAYTAADMAASQQLSYPPNVRIVKVPCTGKVGSLHMMHALKKGADGVLVAGCLPGDCHFKNGNTRAANRVAEIQRLLTDIGWEPERVRMVHMSAGQGQAFAAFAEEFTSTIREMGPNPLRMRAGKAA